MPLERPELPDKDDLDVTFTDEVTYVSRQAQHVWEPVFGHYYATAWLLAERSGGGRSSPPEFFGWLEGQFPEVYPTLLVEAQYPPAAPSYLVGAEGSFEPGTPGAGESLTRAYYDLLAVQGAMEPAIGAGSPGDCFSQAHHRCLAGLSCHLFK